MKFSDITPKNIKHIEKCIETILKRIGVNTSITLSARTIRSEEYIYAENTVYEYICEGEPVLIANAKELYKLLENETETSLPQVPSVG